MVQDPLTVSTNPWQEGPSDLQKAELRKAFTICDVEGKGVIQAKDLQFVTKAILGYGS